MLQRASYNEQFTGRTKVGPFVRSILCTYVESRPDGKRNWRDVYSALFFSKYTFNGPISF
jgi:hypothetical protein